MTALANPFTGLARALNADEILGGRVKLNQPKTGYRSAIDPVLLAAAAEAQAGQRVLDLGCGVGTAGLCLLARVPGALLTGIDKQQALINFAVDNVALNKISAQYICADIATAPPESQSFDLILTNPPYHPAHAADPSPDPIKAASNIESTADLSAWIAWCATSLRQSGTLTMIHLADRSAEICAELQKHNLRRIDLLPLWPKAGQAAKRVLIRARFGGPKTSLLPGLILHRPDGAYTEEANAVLQHAAAISWEEKPHDL